MTLSVECGFCGGGFEVDDIHAGRRVRCPACKRIVRVPPQEEFAARGEQARAEQARAEANGGPSAFNSAEPATYELEEGRPIKAEPPLAPVTEKPEATPLEKANGLGMRRVANALVLIVAVSAALAIWGNFFAIWLAIAPASSSGIHDISAEFRNWAHEFVPSLKQLRPGIGKPFGILDQILVAGILTLLALRMVLRSASLGASYDDDQDKDSRRGVAGLLFHFMALMLLVAVIASAVAAAGEKRLVLSAWFIAAFMVLSALSLAVMRLASGLGGLGAVARVFNDGVFGIAAIVLLSFGGIPRAPFGVLQQCCILALANSIIGLAISGSSFQRQNSGKVAKGLGFSALGVIILLVVVILFSATGQPQ